MRLVLALTFTAALWTGAVEIGKRIPQQPAPWHISDLSR